MFTQSRQQKTAHATQEQVTPGERLSRRIEAQRFFLTSDVADWMAKNRTTTKHPASKTATRTQS